MSAMAVKVVDTSALAAVVFAEAEETEIGDRLVGAQLAAPMLLAFEMANVCLTKLRRNPANRIALLEAFARFLLLPIESCDIDHGAVIALAEQSGLSAYDASYLWLAYQLNAELVTLDRQLARAATSPHA